MESTGEWRTAIYVSSGIFSIYINPAQSSSDLTKCKKAVNETIAILTSSPSYGIDKTYVGWSAVEGAKLGGYPGAYAILEAKDLYSFSPATSGPVVDVNRNDRFLGVHGYAPSHASMLTSFM